MNGDLAARSGLSQRIQVLIEGQDRQGAYVQGNDWYELRVAPSCPPSKVLRFRGGMVQTGYYGAAWADYYHRVYTVPAMDVDLGAPTSVSVDLAFENANWYKFAMLLLQLPAELEEPTVSDWSFYLFETGDEFATSGEAEASMISTAFRQGRPWKGDKGYPLCGLVLANDGTVGAGCPILPVDYVNRGRSYMWPTDVRPRKYLKL